MNGQAISESLLKEHEKINAFLKPLLNNIPMNGLGPQTVGRRKENNQ
jgi:hypothetical protein